MAEELGLGRACGVTRYMSPSQMMVMMVTKVVVLNFILTAAMENFGATFGRSCMAEVSRYQQLVVKVELVS